MSLMVGGGVVAVNACIAVLLTFSESNAVIAGSVEKANGSAQDGKYAIAVHSNMDFGQVMTVNGLIAGGAGGANVSAAGTYFGGRSKAAIDGAGTMENIIGNIRVYTTGITRAIGAAASGAGGVAGVNGTFVMAINRSSAETYIGRSVAITAPGSNVDVFHNITAEARAYNIAVTAVAVAVNASVVLVINNFDAHSWIGHVSDENVSQTNGLMHVNNISVSANAKTITEAIGVAASGGAVAGNGLVALAFNTTGNRASVARKNITAGNASIVSVIDGDTTVLATSLALGAIGVGAIVAAAFSEADNTAELNLSDSVMNLGKVTVNAGTAEKPNNNQALVSGVTGTAGATAINLNIGIAQNSGYNRALVTGGTDGKLTADSLKLEAIGLGRAYAVLAGAAVGAAAVQASVAVAQLENIQEAKLDSQSEMRINGAVTVSSIQKTSGSNFEFGSFDLTIPVKQKSEDNVTSDKLTGVFSSMAQALVFTAGAGAVAATASSANAISDATSRSLLRAENLQSGAITVTTDAESTAVANIQTLSLAAVSVGLHEGYAYAKGTFEALVQTKGGLSDVENNIDASALIIRNTYVSDARATITPALGGVSAGLAETDVNVAVAMNETKAIK